MTDKKYQTTIDDKCQMTDVIIRMWSMLHVVSFTLLSSSSILRIIVVIVDREDCHHGLARQLLRCELYVLVQEWTLASHKRILVHL